LALPYGGAALDLVDALTAGKADASLAWQPDDGIARACGALAALSAPNGALDGRQFLD
jgi:hypothetical protein